MSKKFQLPNNSINFVFHGGSGSSLEDIREAIDYGVIKINIDTDLQYAFTAVTASIRATIFWGI